MELVQGKLLADRFKVVGCLGTGYHGPVFLVQDTESGGNPIALKVLHDWAIRNEKSLELFQQGVASTKSLPRNLFAAPLEVLTHGSSTFLLMEHVEGCCLASSVENNPLSSREILDLMILISIQLISLHRLGYAHNDLSLNKILLTEAGKVRFCGFPYRRGTSLKANFPIAVRFGSAQFKSDEFLESGLSSHQNDIYSLGKIGLTLIERYRDDETPQAEGAESVIRHDDRLGLLPIFLKATDRKPENRYQSMEEFLGALNGAGKQKPLELNGTVFVSLFAVGLSAILGFFYILSQILSTTP